MQQLGNPRLFMMALLAAAIGLSGCQKQQDTEPTLNETSPQVQEIPMSAEPAEPTEMVVIADDEVLVDDPTALEVADDTVANIDTPVSQKTYVCTPELKFKALYDTTAKTVTIDSAQGNLTLEEVGDGAYEAAKALDGSAGLTQWRMAGSQDTSGVLRVSTGNEQAVTAYECEASS